MDDHEFDYQGRQADTDPEDELEDEDKPIYNEDPPEDIIDE